MSRHIKELLIENYRGITNLKLDSLNHINIFTGNNNSGKTSVLEVIYTLRNPEDISTWVECSNLRDRRNSRRFNFLEMNNLFPVNAENKNISYIYCDCDGISKRVELRATLESKQISEGEMFLINGLRRIKEESEEVFQDVMSIKLITTMDSEVVGQDELYDFQIFYRNKSIRKSRRWDFKRVTYISPIDHYNNENFLDNILNTPELYEELIAILKEFDDKIISVNALREETNVFNAYSYGYGILTKDNKKTLSLNSYGDGMKKAVLLLSAIVNSKNGILLIDEFETAIHTSAMDRVFAWLLKSAMKFNVQLFLSSHSKEAIEKVLKIDKELQDCINLYTLYNYDSKNYVRKMSCGEAINALDNLGLELR